MGILDEAPNYAAQAQLWQNYWANDEKQQAQRTAGPMAAAGDWEGAGKAALQRGQLPLYQDLHTLHEQSQSKLAQQVLDALSVAKTLQQYHTILDTLTQHGVPGLSKFRVPAGGDFETTKAATLAEFGKYNDYLKQQREAADNARKESELQLRWAQERRNAAEAAKSKATYLGTITQPGVARETAPAFPTPEQTDFASSQFVRPQGVPGVTEAFGDTNVSDTAQQTPSLSEAMLASEGSAMGLGEPIQKETTTGPERKSMIFSNEAGDVSYRDLPEGAEFEGNGKGNKAKKSRDEFWTDFYKENYPNMSPKERADLVKHQIDKESGQVQVMHALQGPEAGANKAALQQAADIKASAHKSQDERLIKDYQDNHNGASWDEAANWLKEFKIKTSPEEREVALVRAEAAKRRTPISEADALEIVKGAGKQDPAAIQVLNGLMGPDHDKYVRALTEKSATELAGKQTVAGIQLAEYFKRNHPEIPEAERQAKAEEFAKNFNARDTEDERLMKRIQDEAAAKSTLFNPVHVPSTLEAYDLIEHAKKRDPAAIQMLDRILGPQGKEVLEAITAKSKAESAGKLPSAQMQLMDYFQKAHKDETPDQIAARVKEFNEHSTEDERLIKRFQKDAEARSTRLHPVHVPTDVEAFDMIKGARKQEPAEIQKIKGIMGEKSEDWLKAIAAKSTAEAAGKSKAPAIEEANRIMAEHANDNEGPWTFTQALEAATKAGHPLTFDETLFKSIQEHNKNLPFNDQVRLFTDLKTKATEGEREKAKIAEEEGLTTLQTEGALAKAKREGLRPNLVYSATRDGKSGLVFVDPDTHEETFQAHPEGVGNVEKINGSAKTANAELEEVRKLQETMQLSFREALAERTRLTTHPSAELQVLNMLQGQHGSLTPDQLIRKRVELETRASPKEAAIRKIMADHPGETYEDAMARASAANQLQPLTKNPETGGWVAHPISGSLNLRKLDERRVSDLKLMRDDLARDPRNAEMTPFQLDVAARAAIKQSGYDAMADSDGKIHYTVADNSAAAVAKQRADTSSLMAHLRERVATDPTLAAQMTWAREATKQNTKTELRENQTYVVDAHVNRIFQLGGGKDLEHPIDSRKREALDQALGFLHSKFGYRIWVGEISPTSDTPPAAMELLSLKKALQAETGRLLSMGMTSNIAHEHAKELGEVVGELQEVPNVKALFHQLDAITGITSAVRNLPLLSTDPLEAQMKVNERLAANKESAPPSKAAVEQIPVPNTPLTASDGHKYWKVLSPDGTRAEWKRID